MQFTVVEENKSIVIYVLYLLDLTPLIYIKTTLNFLNALCEKFFCKCAYIWLPH